MKNSPEVNDELERYLAGKYAEEDIEVPPSENQHLQPVCEGSPVDSCEEHSIADRISGFRCALHELKYLVSRNDVDQASVAEIARGIQAQLEQCLTSASCGNVGLQISSRSSFAENDSGGVSSSDCDNIF